MQVRRPRTANCAGRANAFHKGHKRDSRTAPPLMPYLLSPHDHGGASTTPGLGDGRPRCLATASNADAALVQVESLHRVRSRLIVCCVVVRVDVENSN
jgi:hypothetical protein